MTDTKKSSIPQSKAALAHAITHVFEKILIDYQTIPATLTRKLAIEGNVKNTTISVCDTLAYLIGWGKLVLKWHDLMSQNKPVDFPETGYKWNQLGLLAQHFQMEYQDWEYAALQQEFVQTTQRILALIDELDNETLYGQAWYDKWTLGRMIQFNTSSPMKNMRTKIRRFIKQHHLI